MDLDRYPLFRNFVLSTAFRAAALGDGREEFWVEKAVAVVINADHPVTLAKRISRLRAFVEDGARAIWVPNQAHRRRIWKAYEIECLLARYNNIRDNYECNTRLLTYRLAAMLFEEQRGVSAEWATGSALDHYLALCIDPSKHKSPVLRRVVRELLETRSAAVIQAAWRRHTRPRRVAHRLWCLAYQCQPALPRDLALCIVQMAEGRDSACA